jgi:triosephosphate isomerase
MKQMLIAANWKMNKTREESQTFANELLNWLGNNTLRSSVLICPPFVNIPYVYDILGNSSVQIGAQNCHFEKEGAYTGEISPQMLISANCKYVIIGHSERRTYFHEDDETINKKIKNALNFGLKPIFCIGETLKERKMQLTNNVLERQIRIGLDGIDSSTLENIVIAYEPVWAIGTGISATNEQIDEAHNFIRKLLVDSFGESGNSVLILYGGSLNSKNAYEIFSLANVNGGLIGKASLDVNEFIQIIKTSEQILSMV